MRILYRTLFTVIAMGVLAWCVEWALRPWLNPSGGLFPHGWTIAQIIEARHRVHLIDPAWLSSEFDWMEVETMARLALIGHIAVIVSAWVWVRRVRAQRPNHPLQRTRPSRRGCNRSVSWAGSLSFCR